MSKKKYESPKVESVTIDATVSLLVPSKGVEVHEEYSRPQPQSTPFDDSPWTPD